MARTQVEALRHVADTLERSGLTADVVSVELHGGLKVQARDEASCRALASAFRMPDPEWREPTSDGRARFLSTADPGWVLDLPIYVYHVQFLTAAAS